MQPRRFVLGVGFAFVGLVSFAGVACSTTNDVTPASKCTPGNYVYCRCEDRSEGTKLCHDDGVSFDPCKCALEGPGGDLTGQNDGGLGSGPLETVDSGPPPTGLAIDPACVGKLGVVAGAVDDLDAY